MYLPLSLILYRFFFRDFLLANKVRMTDLPYKVTQGPTFLFLYNIVKISLRLTQ